jgi:hypothetical protein
MPLIVFSVESNKFVSPIKLILAVPVIMPDYAQIFIYLYQYHE